MDYVIHFFRFLVRNIGKIFLTILSAIVFVFLIFPFSDLNEYVSSEVLNKTNNQVYFQFEQLHVNPLSVSVDLGNISIATPQLNDLSIKQLHVQPDLLSLLKRQPGGTLIADGILSGKASAQWLPSPTEGKSGQPLSKLNLSLENISLEDINASLNLPVTMYGKIIANTKSNIDLTFSEQPDGDLILQIKKFEMPTTTINLAEFGPINLPEIKFSTINLKSKFQSGKYIIENIQLGTDQDELHGTIKGDIDLTVQNNNGRIYPTIKGYNLDLDLLAKPDFDERASFFFGFISQFKQKEPSGFRYKLKLSASSFGTIPRMSPLR